MYINAYIVFQNYMHDLSIVIKQRWGLTATTEKPRTFPPVTWDHNQLRLRQINQYLDQPACAVTAGWGEQIWGHGPLTRYVKLRVAHAPGMPGTFSRPRWVSDPDMHHGTCVTHVPWCIPGLLTSGFLWSRWREKRSRRSQRMRNPQFCVSGKRPMPYIPLMSLLPG